MSDMPKWMAWPILIVLVVSGAAFALLGAAFQIAGALCTGFMEPIKAGASNEGFYGNLLVLVAGDAISGLVATFALTVVGLDLVLAVGGAVVFDFLVDAISWAAC